MESSINEFVVEASSYVSGLTGRNLLMKMATEAYAQKNERISIAYQVECLANGVRDRYFTKSSGYLEDDEFYDMLDSLEKNNKKNNNKNPGGVADPLSDFAEEYLKSIGKDRKGSKKKNAIVKPFNTIPAFTGNPTERMDFIKGICNKMPNEWTIVQVTKGYIAELTASTANQIAVSGAPLFITILKHQRPNVSDEPVLICLNAKNLLNGKFYKRAMLAVESFTEFLNEGITDKHEYWNRIKSSNVEFQHVINEFSTIVGAYAYLLAGKVDDKYKKIQENIFSAVDEFCTEHRLETKTRIILSMICRQISHIKEETFETIAVTFFENRIIHPYFIDFLKNLKKSSNQHKLQFKPCILIVDELLDQMFWEILLPHQEICRFGSFHIFNFIYQHFKDKVSKGYLIFEPKCGSVILNPDKNLAEMEKRMQIFFKYWLPEWRTLSGETPTQEKLMEFFQDDVYVYAGHGSGLHLVKGQILSKLNINAVVFLLGCESVKLRSRGLHGEYLGSHIYYHAALCPAIVGCSIIALDFQADCMGTTIFSKWLPSKATLDWTHVDKKVWNKFGKIKKDVSIATLSSAKRIYEPSLSKALTEIRCNEKLSFNERICLIYRGLPVWNRKIKNL